MILLAPIADELLQRCFSTIDQVIEQMEAMNINHIGQVVPSVPVFSNTLWSTAMILLRCPEKCAQFSQIPSHLNQLLTNYLGHTLDRTLFANTGLLLCTFTIAEPTAVLHYWTQFADVFWDMVEPCLQDDFEQQVFAKAIAKLETVKPGIFKESMAQFIDNSYLDALRPSTEQTGKILSLNNTVV